MAQQSLYRQAKSKRELDTLRMNKKINPDKLSSWTIFSVSLSSEDSAQSLHEILAS